ncbi:MAG TPA: cohesin domain-containing protein, partial [Anaerolineales bacterium]|nr:cohesin domain-containing protein [Anaerolineales bacterium]
MHSYYGVLKSAAQKAFQIVLIFTLMTPVIATGSEPGQLSNVIIKPPAAVTPIGETISVEIYLNEATSLWGGQVALHFDPTILQVVDAAGQPATKIQRGTLLNPARLTEVINVVDNDEGQIEYAATLRNDPHNPVPPATGSGSFAVIHFKGIAAGTSPVIFSVEGATFVHEQLFVQLIDGILQPLVLPTEDGLVTVQSGYRSYMPMVSKSLNFSTVQDTTESILDEAIPPLPETSQQPWPEDWLLTPPPDNWTAPSVIPLDIPELYLPILNAFDMSFVGNTAYYTKQSTLEICNQTSPHMIASVDTTNHAEFTIFSGCSMEPGILVADDSSVYFQEWYYDVIRRIPIGGGSSTILATATNLIKHRGLAVNNGFVYFDDDIGLKRVPIGGGSVETLVTNYSQNEITADASYVYWTEDSLGGANLGAIRRVPNTGGNDNVQTLISAPNVNDPGSLVVDDTNLYWVESGGRARRMPKDGGSPSDYCPADASYDAGSIAINSSYVFWSDSLTGTNGRLRRAPKGGGTVTDLVLGGIFEPLSIGLTTTHIFWIARDGIYRLSMGAQPVKVDLTISGMEVTQGIQNMANDVPLIAEKSTYARIYPAVDLADTPHVTMELHAFRSGFELPGSPAQPVWPEVLVKESGAHREHLADSFLFYIPTSWRTGTIELRAEINPGNVIPESNFGNNVYSQQATFNQKEPVCVVFVPVRTYGSPASTDMPGFFSIIGRMISLWPIAGIQGYTQDEDIAFQGLSGNEPYGLPADNNWVITKLWWRDLWTVDPCDQTYYVGMVSADTYTQNHLGYGSYVSHDSWVKMEVGYITGSLGYPWFESRGGYTMAHEMSHNSNGFFGDRWKHVDCPKGQVPDLTTVYPYDSCQLDVPGPANHYGFDTWIDPHSVIPPESAADYMSYEEPNKWISDFNYKGMYQELHNLGETSEAPTIDWTDTEEYVLVSGIITPTANTAILEPAFRINETLAPGTKLAEVIAQQEAAQAAGVSSAYQFQLVAQDETVLYSQSFDPEPAMVSDPSTSPSAGRLFHLAAPWNTNTAYVRISSSKTILAQLIVSPHTPQVTLLEPDGGEIIGSTMNIHWNGSDEDPSDQLRYTVQYSQNNGATWRAVTTDVSFITFTMTSTLGIPASTEGLIRVV